MRITYRLAVGTGISCPRRIAAAGLRISLVILCALGAGDTALATNGTWIHTSSAAWDVNGNWSGSIIANGTDGIADFSTLNIGADVMVHLNSPRTIGNLIFGDTTPSNNWILDNNTVPANILTLSVSSGSPTITVNNDTATISAVLAGMQGLTKTGAGTLTVSAANTYTGGTIVNGGILSVAYTGNDGKSALGSSNLTINNGGTVRVDTTNALGFNGNEPPTTINAGGLLTASSGVTQHLGSLTLSGGTLASAAPSGLAANYGTYNLDNNLTAGGSTTTSVISATFVALTTPGGTTFTVNPGASNGIDLDVTGTIGAPFGATNTGLIKSGAGVMRMNSANTYTGGTIVNGGILSVGANGAVIPAGSTVQVAAGATFDLGPYTNGSANALSGVTLTGGTLRATGATNSDFYTGQLTMTGGTVDFTNLPFTWIHLTGSGGITTNAAATTATWLGASSSLSRVQNDTASPMTISVGAGSTPSGIDLDAGIALSGSGTNPTFLKFGAGTMRLTNLANTANITVEGGALRADDVSTNGNGVLGGAVTLAFGGALQYGGPTASTTKSITLSGGFGGIIQVLTAGTNLVLTGTIGDSGAGCPLSVYGPPAVSGGSSTLTLMANNPYSGQTVAASNGILAIPTIANGGFASPIGTSSNSPSNVNLGAPLLGIGLNTPNRGTLLLTGTNASYSTDRGVTVFGLYVNGGGGALGVQNGGTSLTVHGQITGNGSFIKTGDGTLILTNNNNYTGGTYVEGGTLDLGTIGPVIPVNSNVTVSAGATFQVGAGPSGQAIGTVTLNGGTLRHVIGGGYNLNQLVTGPAGGTVDAGPGNGVALHMTGAGAGATINGNTTWTGGVGTYIVCDSPGPITVAPNVTLTNSVLLANPNPAAAESYRLAGGGTLYMTTAISNAPMSFTVTQNSRLRVDDLTVTGSGTSVLGAVSSTTVTLDGGALQYSGSTASAAFPLTINAGGGTVEVSNPATTLTLTGTITTNGALNKAGPGVLILNNLANTYPNGIAVSGGRLDVSDDAQLGGATVTVNPAGTLRYTATLDTARTFNLTGGTLEAPVGVTLTLNGAAVNGGFLRGAGSFELTNGATLNGVTTLTSTTLAQTGPVAVTNFSNGGNFTVAAAQTLSWNGGANTTTGRLTVTGAANVSDFASEGQLTITSGGMVSNSGSPLILGGGSRTTINPSGTLAVAAGTTIELNGGLLVNNGTISGTTDVNFGSLAKGTGVYGVVNVGQGGAFSPGNSPGIVTAAAVNFDNTPVISGAPVLQIELAGTMLGTQYDQLAVTGQSSLGGTLALLPVNGFVPVSGDRFVVMTYANRSGTFSSVTGITPAPGLTYSAVYLPTSLVVLTTTTGDKTWGVNSDGTASSGANWIGGIAPGGVGDSAAFTTIITAPRTVTIDVDTTVGTLKFDSSNSYLIAGPHTLTLQAAGATAAAMNISGVHGHGAHTISAPITLASDLNITQNSSGLFTVFGVLDDDAGKQINVLGSGTTAIVGSINLGNATALSVGGTGSLRFGLTTGATATLGTGVTATVKNAATLELAGSVSALSSGTNRANVTTSSNAAAGILVSGANQQVGNIDGSGTTQVNAGSDLTANHIVQTALIIGGTAGNHGLVTIDASDASGNPLGQPSGLALAGSLTSSDPLGENGISSADLSARGGADLAALSPSNSAVGGTPLPVPEPSTLLLVLLALWGAIGQRIALRRRGR